MPGRKCAVVSCQNNQQILKKMGCNIIFHRFPKARDFVSTNICKEWVHRCRRADNFNVDNSSICSYHFTSNDYERDMRNELLGLPIKKILKKTAVPTINMGETMIVTTEQRARKQRFTKKEMKGAMNTLLAPTSIVPSININPLKFGNMVAENPRNFIPDSSQVLHTIESSLAATQTREHFSLEDKATVEEFCEVYEHSTERKEDDNLPVCANFEKIKTEYEEFPEWNENGVQREIHSIKTEQDSDNEFKLEIVKQELENAEIESFGTLDGELLQPIYLKHEVKSEDMPLKIKDFLAEPNMASRMFDSEDSRAPLDFENESVSETEENNCKTTTTVSRRTKRDSEAGKFRCKYCSKTFFHRGSIKMHERIHTGEKPFYCTLCPKSFSQKAVLADHLITHSATEKPFSCKICSKAFTRRRILLVHEKTHTQEKPFPCKHCGKEFSQKSNLRKHELSHTGERRYQCNICGKAFTLNGTLTIHKRKHTGDKPFRCKVCSKEFSQSGTLKRHEKTHTGNKPYKCEVCPKAFARRESLSVHVITHLKVKQTTFENGVCLKILKRETP